MPPVPPARTGVLSFGLVAILVRIHRATKDRHIAFHAMAELVVRGKEQLVLIRPYQGGLMMHTMYYANEVRNFGDIPKAENAKLSAEEIQLGADLIESMSDEFEPDRYNDEYRIRGPCWMRRAKAGRSR